MMSKNANVSELDTETLTMRSSSGASKKQRPAKRAEVEVQKRGFKKRYIVSSVVEGAPICLDFLKAMEFFAQKNKAELVLLWMRGVYKNDHFSMSDFAKIRNYLASEYRFNSKLLAKAFLIHPAQKYPTTGLEEYAQDNDSLICASTKQSLTVVPRPRGKVPHGIYTTGTISFPNYSKTRVGCIATQDNKLGALVVEIPDSKNFFIRQVQWINGAFVDLGKKYTKHDIKSAKCEAMVLGDLHLTEEDPKALLATYSQFKKLCPRNIFIHDVLSNNSINHHERTNYVNRAILPEAFNTLEKELAYGKTKLNEIREKLPSTTNIYIVPSNHDDFIAKFCNDGDFIKDPANSIMGAKCFICLAKKENPLEVFLNVPGVTFLKKGSSLKIEGWECAEHGHLGINGARGTARSYTKSHGRAFIGHSHTPKIVSSVWQVGTLSKLTLPYTSGASSWMHANGVIYEGGHAQMLIFVGEKWHDIDY